MSPRFWPLAPLQGPPWGMNPGVCSFGISEDSSRYPNSKYECSMRSESRYKNLKNFNTVLQRCPRFWPPAPPRGMNPGVYSLGISEDPPRYLSSKFDASVRSDCWDISIWKTLTQCDGNGNANVDDRGDYNSSPCTSYRRAKNNVYPCKPQFYYIKVGFTGGQNYIGMFSWWLPIFNLTLPLSGLIQQMTNWWNFPLFS